MNKVERKKLTFMVIPHNGGEIHSVEIGGLVFFSAVVLLAGVLFFGIFFSYKYFSKTAEFAQNVTYLDQQEEKYKEISKQLQKASDISTQFSAELNKTATILNVPAYEGIQDQVLRGDFAQMLYVDKQHHSNIDTSQSLITISEQLNVNTSILKDINTSLSKQTELMKKLPVYWPVPSSVITMEWGPNLHPIYGSWYIHKGVDLAAPTGTPIYASAEGIVTKASYDPGYGLNIYISHEYGFKTHYSHLNSVKVVKGQEVKQGQKIGTVGATGLVTGPHLDFQVYLGEELIDPGVYLRLLHATKYNRPLGNR